MPDQFYVFTTRVWSDVIVQQDQYEPGHGMRQMSLPGHANMAIDTLRSIYLSNVYIQ